MDPFSDLLNLLSARSYATAGLSAGDDWAMAFSGFDGLKFIAVSKGTFSFRLSGDNAWRTLNAGEGVILTRYAPFEMATNPLIPAVPAPDPEQPRTQTRVNFGGTKHQLLAGKMEMDSASADLLLQNLPLTLFFSAPSAQTGGLSSLMRLLLEEKEADRPGAALACDHLMQLIMIEVLRSSAQAPWGLNDRRIIPALNAIHQQPAYPWRLMELAALSGMSRAGFASKFSESTGQSPLNYLTHWRMRLASKALRLESKSVKQIAFELGYQAESTFSTAFRRVYGHSPSEHRHRFRESGRKEPGASLRLDRATR